MSALCWPDESRIRGNRLRRRRPSRIVAREWAGRKLWRIPSRNQGRGGQGNLGMLGRMGRMAMSGVRVSRYAQRVSLTSVPGSACLLVGGEGSERGGRWAGRHYSVFSQPEAKGDQDLGARPRAKTRFAPTVGHCTIGRPGPKIVPYLPMRQANHQREYQPGRLMIVMIRDSRHQGCGATLLSSRFPCSRSSVSCILCMHDTDSWT